MHSPQREPRDKSGQDLNRVSTVQVIDAGKSGQHWAVLKTNRDGAGNPDGDQRAAVPHNTQPSSRQGRWSLPAADFTQLSVLSLFLVFCPFLWDP